MSYSDVRGMTPDKIDHAEPMEQCRTSTALVAGVIALALVSCTSTHGGKSSVSPAQPPVIESDAAAGPEAAGVAEWIRIAVPDQGVVTGRVERPRSAGPFPAVIILHGTHGFAQEYVRLAEDLARRDVVAVAVCWFGGRGGTGVRFVTPIECPEAPSMPVGSSPAAMQILESVVRQVRMLEGVRSDAVALLGHSRGGAAALHYAVAGDIEAVIVNSAAYPPSVFARAVELNVPVLMMHGVTDGPTEGGSPMTDVQRAREFEAALRRQGKPVEAWYYDGGHNAIFSNPVQYADEVQRIAAFLHRHLK